MCGGERLEHKGIENVLVMGKSGAGKQPRIDVLVDEFGLEQISTGDMFRHYIGLVRGSGFQPDLDAVWNENEDRFIDDDDIKAMIRKQRQDPVGELNDLVLGIKAKYFVESGKYVPDKITNSLFESFFARSDHRGRVIDGYPRTLGQAKYLLDLAGEKGFSIDLGILVDHRDDLILKRLLGRRICPKCKKVFHVKFKPPRQGKYCIRCGTEVVLRSDDTEEKIRERLKEFHEKTAPAIEYLKKNGLQVVVVPGHLDNFTLENVRKSVMSRVEKIL